jgi:serine/threonine-protein kinase
MVGSRVSLPSQQRQAQSPYAAAHGFFCPKCHKRYGEAGRCSADGTILRREDLDPMIGRDIDGRFTITARLGAGSMGTVYRARQNPVGREVAIKILRSERAVDDAAKARFLREARANSLLQSPHTVTVFDFGQSSTGELYLAMELLEGESLGQRLQRLGRLPPYVALDVARQALRSLAEAHGKGIVHRDLKPDNLFFARMKNSKGEWEEIVKVLDFGIAKMLGEGQGPLNAIETQAGTVFGTPRYMSPEQAQAKPLDARTDLYSLGVILYHMLAGRPPFTDDDAIIVMARHIKSSPKPLSEVAPDAKIPAEVEAVVMRALAKDPDKRPRNADTMLQELTEVMELVRSATSGVRASLTSAASFLPRSVPPAPAALAEDSLEVASRPPRASWPWLVVAAGLLGAGALVAWLVASRTREAPHVASAAPLLPPAASTTTPTTAAATSPPAAPTSAQTAVDVGALPKAPATRPPTLRSHPPAPATTAPPPPTATSPAPSSPHPYGIFE